MAKRKKKQRGKEAKPFDPSIDTGAKRYTLLLLSSIFRAIITFPIYVYQMLQNLDASSRFMIDERKLGLLFWNTFRLSKKAALFSVFISEKVASSF